LCRKPLGRLQVAGRHVDARLGQMVNEVEAMKKRSPRVENSCKGRTR